MKQRLLAGCIATLLVLQLAACGQSPEAASPEPEESIAESISGEETETVAEPSAEEEVEEEPEVLSEPEALSANEPEVTAAASVAAEPKTYPAQSTARALSPNDVTVYVQDLGQYTVSDISSAADVTRFADTINELEVSETPAAAADQELGFLLVRDDYTKFQYDLLGDVLRIDSEDLPVKEQDQTALRELSQAGVCGTYAQWLIYMSPTRVEEIQFHTNEGPGAYLRGEGNFDELLRNIRWIGVGRGSGSTYTGKRADYTPNGNANYFQLKLRFDSGVFYTLTFEDNTLYVESTDMAFGCKYTMSNPVDRDALYNLSVNEPIEVDEVNVNPGTGKPVIYLYPQTTQDVEVKLDFKGKLAYTFPAYDNGWHVSARPDGTLTNKADGSTHYYLFWDGDADRSDWDFSKGFVVKGSEVQAFFQEKLPQMGLTPREYNDFITYWTPELARNQYNLITFSTEQYEQTAKLNISPTPDTVLRVHMVYKPLEAPIAIEEQILPAAPRREGFTVVEWGGTRAHYKQTN